MRNGALLSLILFATLLIYPYRIDAKTPDKGIESCFTYYDFGKISVNLSPSQTTANQNSEIRLVGKIINKNTFPLVDTILYAHVRRLNNETFLKNSHYLVEKIILGKDLNFFPGEEKRINVPFLIKSTYPEGDYQIEYFLLSKEAFHYSGRPFLEQDNAGITKITIKGTTKPELYFDINTLRVNGVSRNIREQITEYPPGQLLFDVQLADLRATKSDTNIKIKLYSFEDTFEDKLVTQSLLVAPAGKSDISFSITPPSPGAYVVTAEISSPVQSILKYRFALTGSALPELRINDLGVSDFPAKKNGRIWVCFHSPSTNNSATSTVILTLLGADQNTIEQVSVTDSFDGEVKAISIPLFKLTDPNDFWIEAAVKDEKRSRSTRIHYDCNKFNGAVANLDLHYDTTEPDLLFIQAQNACGQVIHNPSIDVLTIKSSEKITMEKYNFKSSSKGVTLAGLTHGTYTAFAKTGTFKKSTTFTIPRNLTSVENTQNPRKKPPYLIFIIFVLLICGAYIATRVNKKE